MDLLIPLLAHVESLHTSLFFSDEKLISIAGTRIFIAYCSDGRVADSIRRGTRRFSIIGSPWASRTTFPLESSTGTNSIFSTTTDLYVRALTMLEIVGVRAAITAAEPISTVTTSRLSEVTSTWVGS